MTIPALPSYAMPTADEVAANRVDWCIDPNRAVLLIHDMQDYFIDKYDRTQAPIPALIQAIGELRRAADLAGIPVVYTAQPTDQPDSDRALLNDFWGPGLPGAPEQVNVVDGLTPADHDTVLTKWRYSAFQRSPLRQMMSDQGRDQLIITGVYAHIGCMASALEAFMQDVQPFFIVDALADFSREEHLMAINYVARRCGVSLDRHTALAAIGQPASHSAPDTLGWLRQEVAPLIEQSPEDIDPDDNLLFMGLDSMRMMTLAEQLTRQGRPVSFMALAENPTLNDWVALLDAA
ncbi:isochorismatase family protein [Larsenimonas rhizosphaerae]|uniref:isochorismatase n=1 Tax=Larsenimonas rhizosphaerae TaxID=2944682 RepID=A0AA41ZGZ6_9GAMM|nr:isochorismatase family protein [Larsenimonas rhizosphaerae]MCM2129831.1 isochorismatase family protein [Larsenimonas rhizosphaerae]MCX2524491.1 isochorismatase family protein [Larsenimonas rhizosphaerae]